MTVKQYLELLDLFIKDEQKELDNITTNNPDNSNYLDWHDSEVEQYAYHEGVKWAYLNVIALFQHERIAKHLYDKYIARKKKKDI